MERINKPKILILGGDGINCEMETRDAFELSNGAGTICHINDLLKNPLMLRNFQILVIPGGFSFGDHLGSGKVFSLKLKYGLIDSIFNFINSKKPVLGICNGFQVLSKLGLIPNVHEQKSIALKKNDSGQFQNSWVEITINSTSNSIWTKKLIINKYTNFILPIRHGEGKLVFNDKFVEEIPKDQIVFQYNKNINGSYLNIAGISDSSGLILGMMPHPEAAIWMHQLPLGNYKKKIMETYLNQKHYFGLMLFQSAIEYCNQS